jgi:NAD(P)-dependent dehydrogenase (short-subunit alcohol dehydrogenase family)
MNNRVLSGKKAVITGSNQGLGLEIARTYVLAGAEVMLCARDTALLQDALAQLTPLAGAGQRVLAQTCDVSKPEDVQGFAREALAQLGGCHILVNNAGIYGPKGDIESVAWADWVKTMEINVYGSVLMCQALVPHFKSQRYGKIIQLSGGGATSPMPRISAYAASKAAIVRFAETLAEEVRGTGIDVNCMAPGALNTRMLDEILQAGPQKVGQAYYDRCVAQKQSGGAPMARAAELALFLASEAGNGISGKLIAAVWDDWERWPEHLDELRGSDAYTLRRITGRERGLAWGDK